MTARRRHGREAARASSRWRKRLPLAVPFVAAAILLLIPAVAVKSSKFEGDLIVSTLSFAVGGDGSLGLLPDAFAASLHLHGFDRVEFLTGTLELRKSAADSWQPAPAGNDGVIVGGPDADVTLTNVNLTAMRAPSGTKVSLSAAEEGQRKVTIKTAGAVVESELVVEPQLTLTCQRCASTLSSDSPVEMRLTANRDQIVRVLSGSSEMTMSFMPAAPLVWADDSLAVDRAIYFYQMAANAPHNVSGIREQGLIVFPETADQRKVFPRSFLAISGSKSLRIVSMELDRLFHLRLAGVADSVRVGVDEPTMEDIVPSWLQWLHQQSPWTTLGTDVVLLGSAVLTVLTRLKLVKNDEK